MKRRIKNQTFSEGDKVWRIPRLISLSKDFKVFKLPLKHLNIFKLYPNIGSTKEFVRNIKYVLDADVAYPIILDEEGYVMDGRHRIVHALLYKLKFVNAVRFKRTPECCFIKKEK